MRITTYEKGGNSLNPFIKLFIFLIILGLFVMPVNAISDNFNDQEIISDWTIDSGSWLFSNSSSIEGSDDYYVYTVHPTTSWGGTSNIEYEIYRSQSSDNKYYEIDIKTTGTQYPGIYAKSIFVFESNGVDENSIYIGSSTTSFGLYSDTFTVSTISLSQNTWYHVEIITLGTNVQIDVYDMDDNLIARRTSTYTPISDSDQLSLKSNLIDGHVDHDADLTSYFDNLYTSSTVDTGAASGILWESASYTEGDTGKYTWNIDSDAWYSFLYKHKIVIEKDGTEIYSTTIGKSGDRYYDFDIAGTYTAKLLSSKIIFTNWVTVASDNTHAYYEVDSFINVPSTSAIKTNFTTTYLYGSTPITPIINIKVLQNDYTYKVIDTKILPAAIAGTTYTANLSISSLSPIGYYVIELYDNGQGKSFATDTIQTTYAYIPPSDIVLSSYINTTDSIYSLGGIISGSYAIDDTNYTDYYTKLQVYNIDKDIISFSFIPLHQVDNFDIPITNSELDFYSDGVNRYPISTNFLSGENAVRLASYNTDGSLNEVITQKNITLSIINDEGYGLTLSKYIVDETEIFAIKAITPVQASIVIHPLTLMGISDTTILINGSTQMSYAIGIADTYTISLVSGGETKITQIIKVFEGEEIITPIDEDEVIPDTTFQDNTTSLLNSPYLIGLFIMCVFLSIGATNGIGGIIVTGSIGLGIVCWMGIFPWILLVIEVLAVAVLMAKGMINLSGD